MSRGSARVLIVIRQFHPLAAGAETQALRQAQSYIAMGRPARVVTARHDPALPAEDSVEGVPVTRLRTGRLRVVGSLVFLVNLAAWLVRNRRRYDVVLAFHLKQAAALAALVCSFLGKRVVISVQAAGELGDIRALGKVPLGGALLWCCKRANAFVSGAGEITEELTGAGIPSGKIHFIPNGIPIDRFTVGGDEAAVRKKLGLPANAFVVVNIGRHTAQKDLGTVLTAWRDFAPRQPPSLLVLVGDGDQRGELESFVADNNLAETVRFEGWRPNVPEYLAAADVFASSSRYEGTHIALGEAMAAGLPVIATPVGGARDFVGDGENGFIVDIGDSGALAEKLALLAKDRELRARLGAAARLTVESELEQEQTAKRHVEVLLPERTEVTRPPVEITHVIATLDRGGSETQMAELAARCRGDIFKPRVICLTRGGPTEDILDEARVPYRVLGKSAKADISCFLRLLAELVFRPPALLQTWLFTSNLYARLAAIVAGTRRIIACERSTDPWKSRAHRFVDRVLGAFTDRMVANSEAVRGGLIRSGIPPRKVTVIPNGVDTDRFKPRDARKARAELGLALEGRWFGFIGRLAFEKRPEVFLEAAKAVLARDGNARAVLFGDGPMRGELEAAAADFGERIIFQGDCDKVEIAHAAIDCLV
ncbi:MAG: glycosyltransferase, partial [Planctomycetota bacterium]